jgi:hypothetical protein
MPQHELEQYAAERERVDLAAVVLVVRHDFGRDKPDARKSDRRADREFTNRSIDE